MTINPTTPEAVALAHGLLATMRFGALAVAHPESGRPYVSRVACIAEDGGVLMLVSTLSTHTQALQRDPHCALLVGEPGDKGDPLTHPRMTLSGAAAPVEKARFKQAWLAALPKAQLYYDFADFIMYRLTPDTIDLNGGFGKAYRLGAQDLRS